MTEFTQATDEVVSTLFSLDPIFPMPLDNAGNTLTTARELHLGTGNQVRSFSDRVDASDLTDYYRFRVAGRSSFGLQLSNSGGDANLELLNANGDRLQDSLNSGHTSELINTILEAGTYYVRIASVNGTGSDYELEINQTSNSKADILWRNTVSGQNVVWQMDGTTIANGLSITPVEDLNWQMVASGDFNRDGQSDLVWRHSVTGKNVIWLMDGTTIASGLEITAIEDLNWQITTAGDFNQDGQADLVWRNSVSGKNVIWLMDGTTIASGLEITAVEDLNWKMITSGDFNNDGQSDLVWRHSVTGQNVIWLMDGTTIASGLEITALPDLNWQMVGSGDFDQDGQSDLVWRNQVSGHNVVWHMNGTSVRSRDLMRQIPDLNWQIADVTHRYEPIAPIDLVGNTLTSAFQLGTISGNSRFTEWIGGGDASDYYQFTVINPSNINFTLSTPNALGDILDSSGNAILVQRSNLNLNALLSAGTYYIRINSRDQLTNYTLSIAHNDIARIVVTTPNNGEVLRPGATYNITWRDNISETVAIHLFKGNSFLTTLTASTDSDGSYLWTLPTNIGYGIDYRIAVSTADAKTYDFSDNYFSIKPDLSLYFFQYLFNPEKSTSTDSYSGSVIAVNNKYSVTPQQAGGRYLLSDLYNFTDRLTEIGTDGRYVILRVLDYNDDLINDLGRVFVNQYVDRDQGHDRFFTPVKFEASQPSGTNYLGSEVDYIDALGRSEGRFGLDYYEANPLRQRCKSGR